MEFHLFHLMPRPDLPADFEQQHELTVRNMKRFARQVMPPRRHPRQLVS